MWGRKVVVCGLAVAVAGFVGLPLAAGVSLSIIFAVVFCLWRFLREKEPDRPTKTHDKQIDSIVIDGLKRYIAIVEYDRLTDKQRERLKTEMQASRRELGVLPREPAESLAQVRLPDAIFCPMCQIHQEAGWPRCPICEAVFKPGVAVHALSPRNAKAESGCSNCLIYRLLETAECPDCGSTLRRKTWQR
jgi:hypothetical protein